MFTQDIVDVHGRRRSVDVGGLALALADEDRGHGWGGWEDQDSEIQIHMTSYAELLSDMYTHTQRMVTHDHLHSPPIEVADNTRTRLIKSLGSWNFEPHKLPPEEVLSCTIILFQALWRIEGMQEQVGVSLCQITDFLHHMRQLYRTQNAYHNFQHALDVLQAAQSYLYAAGMVPPVSILLAGDERTWRPDKHRDTNARIACLDNQDLLTLYIAAIGHDVGHPGFTNALMKNARAPLSLVYDDKSALEQMHYALLLQIMRHHGLGALLDNPVSGTARRKLMFATILATDMSLHRDFMERFEALVDGKDSPLLVQKVLICQALIKCADISNPSRPHKVSQHWASALAEEWASQAKLEALIHLPSTVQPANGPLGEASSQVFFTSTFVKPLLELTARAIPEIKPFVRRCAINLATWQARHAELSANPPPLANSNCTPTGQRLPADLFLDAFHLTLPTQLSVPGWHTDPPPHVRAQAPERPTLVIPTFSATPVAASPSESIASSHVELSPLSDVSSFIRRPSSAGTSASASSAGTSASTTDAAVAIRAAYRASTRKKPNRNRGSWDVGTWTCVANSNVAIALNATVKS
ncbi:hypothetical protein PLICRDRAFT_162678 [Plicaturopsis crispa FD-325 SS-3]|nr:hypothetical protein PLICRDRAFT_162678 [Plicaturopsis crispa FD-325 SS-3]